MRGGEQWITEPGHWTMIGTFVISTFGPVHPILVLAHE